MADDDLVDELQELAVTPWLNSQARVACRSAADEIERLRAVIAEALAALDPPRPHDPSEHADYAEGLEDGAAIKSERLRAILSCSAGSRRAVDRPEAVVRRIGPSVHGGTELGSATWQPRTREQYDAEEGNRG